jgi:hypothetical protein
MRVGAARVKFKYSDGYGDGRNAIMAIDYGDDGDVDFVEVNEVDWFSLVKREYVLRQDVEPDDVVFGVNQGCRRTVTEIAFSAPKGVEMYPEAF